MGYIIPVTHYDYIQYTNRTVGAEKSAKNTISRFLPVQPVNFHRRSEERNTFSETVLSTDYQPSSQRLYKRAVPTEIVERTAVEVTGIGQFVNESI